MFISLTFFFCFGVGSKCVVRIGIHKRLDHVRCHLFKLCSGLFSSYLSLLLIKPSSLDGFLQCIWSSKQQRRHHRGSCGQDTDTGLWFIFVVVKSGIGFDKILTETLNLSTRVFVSERRVGKHLNDTSFDNSSAFVLFTLSLGGFFKSSFSTTNKHKWNTNRSLFFNSLNSRRSIITHSFHKGTKTTCKALTDVLPETVISFFFSHSTVFFDSVKGFLQRIVFGNQITNVVRKLTTTCKIRVRPNTKHIGLSQFFHRWKIFRSNGSATKQTVKIFSNAVDTEIGSLFQDTVSFTVIDSNDRGNASGAGVDTCCVDNVRVAKNFCYFVFVLVSLVSKSKFTRRNVTTKRILLLLIE